MESQAERGLKRKMLLLALGIRPGDVREAIGADPVRVSGILGGYDHVRPEEMGAVRRLVAQKTRVLFGAGNGLQKGGRG